MQHKKKYGGRGDRELVILLITFDFQYFLTQELQPNPYKIELISLESL